MQFCYSRITSTKRLTSYIRDNETKPYEEALKRKANAIKTLDEEIIDMFDDSKDTEITMEDVMVAEINTESFLDHFLIHLKFHSIILKRYPMCSCRSLTA